MFVTRELTGRVASFKMNGRHRTALGEKDYFRPQAVAAGPPAAPLIHNVLRGRRLDALPAPSQLANEVFLSAALMLVLLPTEQRRFAVQC